MAALENDCGRRWGHAGAAAGLPCRLATAARRRAAAEAAHPPAASIPQALLRTSSCLVSSRVAAVVKVSVARVHCQHSIAPGQSLLGVGHLLRQACRQMGVRGRAEANQGGAGRGHAACGRRETEGPGRRLWPGQQRVHRLGVPAGRAPHCVPISLRRCCQRLGRRAA